MEEEKDPTSVVSQPIFVLHSLPDTGEGDFSSEIYSSTQNWSLPVIRDPCFSYTINEPAVLPQADVVPYNNEHNLAPEETTTFLGKLEPQTISQFLNKSTEQYSEDLGFDLNPISAVTTYRPAPKPEIKISPDFDRMLFTYLKVQLHPIGLHGSSQPMTDYSGILFLYDSVLKAPVTEAAYFSYINSSIKFNRAGGDTVYFKTQKNNQNVKLVCILSSGNIKKCDSLASALSSQKQSMISIQNSANAAPSSSSKGAGLNPTPSQNAINGIMLGSLADLSVPFATSFLSPFIDHSENNFAFSWLLLDQSDSISKIGSPPAGSDPSTMLIGRVTIQQLSELPEYSTSMKVDQTKPYLCMNIPSNVFEKNPIITMSNISFSFNSPPKKETSHVYFKVYLCENVHPDINRISGTTGFSPVDNRELTDVYISTKQRPGKKVVFPDVIRFYVQKKLSKQAHLVFQYILVTGKNHEVYKDAVVELFPEGVPISQSIQQFPTNQVKNLTGDYITKSKVAGRSMLSISIDMPSGFFPHPQFEKLAEALVPMQVDWNSIVETPIPILRKQALPTFVKLLSIISPQTIKYIVHLLSMFEGDDYVRDLLRSWIFNKCDTKKMKHNFLSAFTNALDQFIQESIENDLVSTKNLVQNFDMISSLIIIAYMQKTEEWIPASLITLFGTISDLIFTLIQKKGQPFRLMEFNMRFGWLIYVFASLIDAKTVTKIINSHIRKLLHIMDPFESMALAAIFEFLIPFTQTTDFALYYSTRLPIRPLGKTLFSPFQATLSLIFMAISRALNSNKDPLIKLCCDFIARLTLPLETLSPRTRYRIGFALFPLFDILTVSYETVLKEEEKEILIPTVLFLLAYMPRILVKVFFETVNKNFQQRIMNFISAVAKACLNQLMPQVTAFNGQLNELTKRVLMFFASNISKFGQCIKSAVNLVSIIAKNPYQIPRNYPRIFSAISQLIQRYPCQRSLINNLLSMITMKQHIARCFATSLTLLFFKADFDARKNVVVSSAEVLDELTSIMLQQPVEMIPMYKLLLRRINEHSAFFNNPTFTSKVEEKLKSAANIADVINTMRHTAHEPADKCEYVMQIANQYISYPSMRMKWLSEIVSINIKNECYSAAFVAQLHICALISTVIEHEQRIKSDSNDHTITPPKQHNLLVCQPMTFSKPPPGRDIQLFDKDFEFIPSVLMETKIDFESVNDDFKFISSDFTLDLLKKALNDAIVYGEKAKMFYSVRCVRSIQMRIFSALKQYSELANICKSMEQLFKSMSATVTSSYDIPLTFCVQGTRIFCYDNASSADGLIVYPHDSSSDKIEHSHAWSIFRTRVQKDLLKDVKDADSKELLMIQYTVKHALPRFTMCSEISNLQEVKISLKSYADMETDKLCRYMEQCSCEFERCFPCRNLQTILGNHQQNIERDLRRVVALIDAAHGSNDSLFYVLQILNEKGGVDFAQLCAQKLCSQLQRLVKVYHRAIEYLQSEEHFMAYARVAKSRLAFTTYFGLPEIDTKGYEGRRDPISEKYDYEN